MWLSKKIPVPLFVSCFLVIGAAVGITFYSQSIGEGIRSGLSLCGELVIPSLFVFLCLCEWVSLSGIGMGVVKVFKPVFRLFLGRFYQGGTALFLCLLGGYPMGASSLVSLKNNGRLSLAEIRRLALWIFCPSPAFVVIGVGQGMLGSFRTGLILWVSCVASCLLTGAVISRFPVKEMPISLTYDKQIRENNGSIVQAVSSATEKMLHICGMVILVAGVLGCLSALPLPDPVKSCFTMFLEVTNGSRFLAFNGGSLPQMGAVLMFGGIGTHLQCKGLLKEACPSYLCYFFVRILQALLCYGLLCFICYQFPQVVPTFSVGNVPVPSPISVLPSVGLMGTCCVFLCSLHQKPFFRSDHREKSRIYSK